jgi:hypothetical protein
VNISNVLQMCQPGREFTRLSCLHEIIYLNIIYNRQYRAYIHDREQSALFLTVGGIPMGSLWARQYLPRPTAEDRERNSASETGVALAALDAYLSAMEQGYTNLRPFARRVFMNRCSERQPAAHSMGYHLLPGGHANADHIWCVLSKFRVQDPHFKWLMSTLQEQGRRIEGYEYHAPCGCSSFYVYPRKSRQ